jgi:hypothetical protein
LARSERVTRVDNDSHGYSLACECEDPHPRESDQAY